MACHSWIASSSSYNRCFMTWSKIYQNLSKRQGLFQNRPLHPLPLPLGSHLLGAMPCPWLAKMPMTPMPFLVFSEFCERFEVCQTQSCAWCGWKFICGFFIRIIIHFFRNWSCACRNSDGWCAGGGSDTFPGGWSDDCFRRACRNCGCTCRPSIGMREFNCQLALLSHESTMTSTVHSITLQQTNIARTNPSFWMVFTRKDVDFPIAMLVWVQI